MMGVQTLFSFWMGAWHNKFEKDWKKRKQCTLKVMCVVVQVVAIVTCNTCPCDTHTPLTHLAISCKNPWRISNQSGACMASHPGRGWVCLTVCCLSCQPLASGQRLIKSQLAQYLCLDLSSYCVDLNRSPRQQNCWGPDLAHTRHVHLAHITLAAHIWASSGLFCWLFLAYGRP